MKNIPFCFEQIREVRMGSPYHICTIRFSESLRPRLPTTDYQDLFAVSPDEKHYALVRWDTPDNEPGFRVIIVNSETADLWQSQRIKGCCKGLELAGSEVIIRSTSTSEEIKLVVE